MGLEKGIISTIEAVEPRDFGHGMTSIHNLMVNNKKYSIFVSERNGAYVLKDKNYTTVTQGMEVEFMYDTSDKGNKIQFKTFSITPNSTQPVQQQQVPPPVQQATPQATTASDALTADDLKDMVADGQAACNALVKGKTPSMDMLKRMSGYYRKVL